MVTPLLISATVTQHSMDFNLWFLKQQFAIANRQFADIVMQYLYHSHCEGSITIVQKDVCKSAIGER